MKIFELKDHSINESMNDRGDRRTVPAKQDLLKKLTLIVNSCGAMIKSPLTPSVKVPVTLFISFW